MNSLKQIVVVAVVLLVSGCASSPNTFSHVDPTVDFGNYKSYGFMENLSTDKANYESMHSNFLKVAVAQELDQRGMEYSADPDLLINFYILTSEKIRTRTVPTGGTYYGYRAPYYDTWGAYGGYETRVDQYTEGTLHIDFVDPNSKKLVWEGGATGRVTDEKIRNLEETIDNAVVAIMREFPIQASATN